MKYSLTIDGQKHTLELTRRVPEACVVIGK